MAEPPSSGPIVAVHPGMEERKKHEKTIPDLTEATVMSPGDSDGISTEPERPHRAKTERESIERKTEVDYNNEETPAKGMRSPGLMREKD